MSDMGDEPALEMNRLDGQNKAAGDYRRYLWQGQVWKPGRTVSVYRHLEPPQFVLAFRQSNCVLERQAPAANGSSLWTWTEDGYGLEGFENVVWARALDHMEGHKLVVVRVANEPSEATVHVGPIMPGKWYREHTADQLRQEHVRRGLTVDIEWGVPELVQSLHGDDEARQARGDLVDAFGQFGVTREQATAAAGEAAAALRRTASTGQYSASTITWDRSAPPGQPRRDAFSPFPAPLRRPAEPEQGTVLGFTKHYSEDGPGYSFAAVRATNRHAGWFLSGPKHTAQPLTWDQILDFIGGPIEWARIGVVNEWVSLGDL